MHIESRGPQHVSSVDAAASRGDSYSGPPPEVLEELLPLYRAGRCLTVYERCQAYGPLKDWTSIPNRIFAGRLALQLGGWRLGTLLHHLAFRHAPSDPEARYYGLLTRWQRRGTFATWEAWRCLDPPAQDPKRQADWWALGGHLLASLRDFWRADEAMRRAIELAADDAWIWVEASNVHHLADRRDEAFAAAERATAIAPNYPPAAHAYLRCLLTKDRTDEALAYLIKVSAETESGTLCAHLAALQGELGLFTEARSSWERVAQRLPLLEKKTGGLDWLYSRQADAAYDCQDYDVAQQWAERCEFPFYKRMAERLRDTDRTASRRRLDVGFVQQHHMTCAPATLTAISQFWKRPVEHLEVAEQICYDGTPSHNERLWAERQGFVVREFRVTWENARTLLDANVPFTLTTVMPGSAHLQAVIGYDALLGTLTVRDPTQRLSVDMLAQEMIESQAVNGPRGMLMVPASQIDALGTLELADADLYDDYFQLHLALERHDRDAAQQSVDRLAARAPDHRLRYWGQRSLAAYDANPLGVLEAIENLLRLYPSDVNLCLARLSCLRELGRRSDRLRMLHELCEYGAEANQAKAASQQAARTSSADVLTALRTNRYVEPMFLLEYAWELSEDSRQFRTLEWLVRRALQHRPQDALAVRLLANVRWNQNRRDEAWELYRLAACTEATDEGSARTFFSVSRHLKRVDEALAFLRERVDRYGKLSSWPARTLSYVYEQLELPEQALATLESAMREHPDDGELLLAAAHTYMTCGRDERAAALLESARKTAHRDAWLRGAARLADIRGDRIQALALWREVVEHQPLAIDAHRSIVDLLNALEGEAPAIAHVEQALERFPHNNALHVMRVEQARSQPEVYEQVVRRMLEAHPDDPWAHRELAFALFRASRMDDALAALKTAGEYDPNSPVVPFLQGQILRSLGQLEAAKDCFRTSLQKSVDYSDALDGLLLSCDTKPERVEALRFVVGELVKQVNFGEGLAGFYGYAAASLEADELIAVLREAHRERPDLWQTWMTLCQGLEETGQRDEALAIARQAVERFPLLPRLWLTLAAILQSLEQFEEAQRAIEQALEINPAFGEADRALARLFRTTERLAEARDRLERAVRWDPREFRNHALLAEVLWDQNERERALEALLHAVELEPGYDHGWDLLAGWAWELDRATMALDAARSLVDRRPKEARSWVVLADLLARANEFEEMHLALDKAIELSPRNDELYSRKAYWLAERGDFDAALANCSPPIFEGHPPIILRSRAAQVLAKQGDRTHAMAQMEQVLADDPDYVWAWFQLIDWYRDTDRHEDYLRAAENLVRLVPQDVRSFGYRGDARLRLGQRPEALADFQHAIEVEPNYPFAAKALFEERLADGDLVGAEDVRNRTQGHVTLALSQWFSCRLALARQDEGDFAQQCVTFLASLEHEFDLLYELAQEVERRNWGWGALAGALGPWIAGNADRAEFGHVWCRCTIHAGDARDAARKLRAWKGKPAWPHASAALIEHWANQGQNFTVKWFLLCNRRALRADDRSWAAAGVALADLRQEVQAARWLRDWSTRAAAPSSALFNLALCLRWLKRDAEAHQVNLAGLDRPADGFTAAHAIWLATDACVDGDLDRTRELLERSGQELPEYYQTLVTMIRVMLDCCEHSRLTGEQVVLAERQLANARNKFSSDRSLIHFQYKCRRVLARRAGQRLRGWWIALGAMFET